MTNDPGPEIRVDAGPATCHWGFLDAALPTAAKVPQGQPVRTGLVATLAYLGPRGAEALMTAWLCRKK